MDDRKIVYLDNSASTRLDERVLQVMREFYLEKYAVATSEFGYSMGVETREALDKARKTIAKELSVDKHEIVFTSGSSESSNMAIKGVARKLSNKEGNHIIISKIEDFPVLNSAKSLQKEGFEVTFLDVDEYGMVNLDKLNDSIRDDTILVSIQHANQEIGTLQDIETIADICKKKDALFHTDATHTFCRTPLNLKAVKADLVTISAHTIHGPRGVGALFIREGTPILKYLDGGYQEFNLRGEIENVPGIMGFAKAVELIDGSENEKIAQMRDTLMKKLTDIIDDTTINGHPKKRIPQNANITFHFVEGESITLHLDMRGIAVSTGSACFSKSLSASHVILGIGGDHERAHGSVRFTFGRFNSIDEIDYVTEHLNKIITQLRSFSPLAKKKGE